MAVASREQEATALILVDHGSREPAANAVVVAAAEAAAERSEGRYVAVLPAHMELASPSIEEAFDAAVAAGARVVVVVLFFLGPGRHSTRDIPALASQAAARHAGVRFVVTSSLGPDEVLAGLALERAAAALGHAVGALAAEGDDS